MQTQQRAYFVPVPDGLQPVPEARSPWAADMPHGRLLAGLAARAAENAGHDPALRIARLTVDMFRTPPMTPFRVETAVIRDGRRVRVVDIRIRAADIEVARATALMLRGGPHPHGAIWRAPEWSVPHPDTLEAGNSDDSGGWDIRPLTPAFWTAERGRLWTRDRWQPSPAKNHRRQCAQPSRPISRIRSRTRAPTVCSSSTRT